MAELTPLLFQPIALRGVVARNRIMVSPMSQYQSSDGTPGDWQLVHLGKFAMGGAGIVFGEETAVEAGGRKTYRNPGLYLKEHVRAYRRINDFLHEQHALSGMQLGHSGRRGSTRTPLEGSAPLDEQDAALGCPPWGLVAPSANPRRPGLPAPHALDRSEIGKQISIWREAALRTVDAGFDICEIHGAHGYLIHQFLSPIANQRTDDYGGSLEGRMRFALEITEAVRAVWPADKPLFFRVSAMDGKGGRWSLDDTVVLARALKERGVDVVDCSAGGITGPGPMRPPKSAPGYQVEYADRVRREAGVATVAVGLITQAQQAEAILQAHKADLIGVARELLYDPFWPMHAAREMGVKDYLGLLPASYHRRLALREAELGGSAAGD